MNIATATNLRLTRRQFLLLTAGLAAGCQSGNNDAQPAARTEQVIDAGPAGDFAAEGVYSRFRDRGFFVIRQGGRLFALSAICTHRKCKLIAERDRSFSCPCHGSTFTATGQVTDGPARRDLPVLPARINEQGRLIVSLGIQ